MITIDFPGFAPKAKARPRHDGRTGRMHMPDDYLDWKRSFAYTAQKGWAAWLACSGYPVPSIIEGPIAVSIIWRTTTGNMRPDVDNALGSCLDALQEAKVFANDSQVREIHGRMAKVKKHETGITVTIEEL